MEHNCKYYLMNAEGIRVCSVCGKPASSKPRVLSSECGKKIEDKMVGRHEDKAPLYVSKKDKARQEV